MTKYEKVIVSAFTGSLMCDFVELHAYIEEKLGRPVFTHELANEQIMEEIRLVSKDEFLAICKKDEADQGSLISVDKIVDLLFELFDQHDISVWEEIAMDSDLAAVWTSLVKFLCVDEKDHEQALKYGLRARLYSLCTGDMGATL